MVYLNLPCAVQADSELEVTEQESEWLMYICHQLTGMIGGNDKARLI